MKYRKKPIIIEAYKFTGDHDKPGFPDGWITSKYTISDNGYSLYIETLEGKMLAHPGDYIIKGTKDEFYPCKEDIFVATYEPFFDASFKLNAQTN